MGFTEEALAQRSGASPERIRRLVQLGVLTPEPGDEAPFRPVDIQRVRVAQTFEDSGFELESLGRAIGSGAISFSLLDLLFPDPASLSDMTYRTLADQMGLPMELIDRLHIGFGLPRPDPDDLIRDDDAELLPLLPTIIGVGLSEAELIRGVRMYGENLRRVAESQVQLLHTHVGAADRLRGRGHVAGERDGILRGGPRGRQREEQQDTGSKRARAEHSHLME